MVEARVGIVESLKTISNQSENTDLKRVFDDVRRRIERGKSLSESLSRYPQVFSNLYVQLVKVGEQAGILDQVLLRLADYLERSDTVRRKVRSALAYPILVLLVASAATIFLLTVIVPTFAEMYQDYGADLPVPTQVLLNLSNVLTGHYILILLAALLLIVLAKHSMKRQALRAHIHAYLLKVPLVGTLIRTTLTARFTRMLGTMLHNKVQLVEALSIMGNSATFFPMKRAVQQIKRAVIRGDRLSSKLPSGTLFPPMVVQMIAVGEETGELDTMLLHIAEHQEAELEQKTDSMLSLLEPILILVIGALLGGILIALYLPLFDLSQIIQ